MVGETIVRPSSSPGLVYRAIEGMLAVVVVVVAAGAVVVAVVVVVREATVRLGTRMALVGGIAADMSVGRTIEECLMSVSDCPLFRLFFLVLFLLLFLFFLPSVPLLSPLILSQVSLFLFRFLLIISFPSRPASA